MMAFRHRKKSRARQGLYIKQLEAMSYVMATGGLWRTIFKAVWLELLLKMVRPMMKMTSRDWTLVEGSAALGGEQCGALALRPWVAPQLRQVLQETLSV